MLELLVAFVLAANFVLLRRFTHLRGVYRNSLGFLAGLFILLAAQGETAGSHVLWMYLLPLILFFVLGKTEGLVWNVIIGALALVLFLAGLASTFTYSQSMILRFAVTYSCLIAFGYIYEVIRDSYQKSMTGEHARLIAANRRIQKLSITDALTGVRNRGFMDDYLPDEIRRGARYNRPLKKSK